MRSGRCSSGAESARAGARGDLRGCRRPGRRPTSSDVWQLRSGCGAMFLDGLAEIDIAARRSQTAALGGSGRGRARPPCCEAVEQRLPAFFAALVEHTYRGYYTLASVQRAVGFAGAAAPAARPRARAVRSGAARPPATARARSGAERSMSRPSYLNPVTTELIVIRHGESTFNPRPSLAGPVARRDSERPRLAPGGLRGDGACGRLVPARCSAATLPERCRPRFPSRPRRDCPFYPDARLREISAGRWRTG